MAVTVEVFLVVKVPLTSRIIEQEDVDNFLTHIHTLEEVKDINQDLLEVEVCSELSLPVVPQVQQVR
jgi:hypothetical protein